MLNDLNHLYTDDIKIDKAVDRAKTLFGSRKLYTLYTKLDGDVVIFDDVFIQKVRYALTSMHTSQMTPIELQLVEDMVEYQNTGYLASRNNTSAGNLANLLDDYLSDSIDCTVIGSDYEDHEWISCQIEGEEA
jgi:hypothetical protein